MFALTPSNAALFAVWVLIGLVSGLWISFSLVRYRNTIQPDSTETGNAVLTLYRFWSDFLFSKAASIRPGQDESRIRVLKKRLRLGYVGLIAWLVTGLFFFGHRP